MANTYYDGTYNNGSGSMFVGNNFYGQANFNNLRTPSTLNLPIARGAAYGDYANQDEGEECLEGTRTELLRDIAEWAENQNGKRLFWMRGMAGTGKSTISRTIARTFKSRGILGATFFFKRGEANRADGSLFFTTIAVQLAHRVGTMSALQEAADANPGISVKGLKEQFDKLILEPLSQLKPGPGICSRIIIIVDALDECKRSDVRIIIRLLAQLTDHIEGVSFRIFLTSRPERPIYDTFDRMPKDISENLALHEVPEIEHDILRFLKHKLSEIAQNEDYELSSDWPGENVIQELARRAIPLFIYAATMCRFIANDMWDPERQLKVLMEYRTESRALKLNQTYLPILNQQIVDLEEYEKEELVREFQVIVGTIINLVSPLSSTALARLLGLEERAVNCRLSHLQSVLDVPRDRKKPVRPFHLSFPDFLTDINLQNISPFWIDKKQAHRRIARQCIALMDVQLKKDICNLKSPGILRSEITQELIQKHISMELQYACRYWVHHVKESEGFINVEIHQFLQKHILHWLEAVSLLGDMPKITYTIQTLKSIKVSSCAPYTDVSELIHDIYRFVLFNKNMFDTAPLQTYIAGTLFAPENSKIKRLFPPQKEIHWARGLPFVQQEWSPLLQALEGHDGQGSIDNMVVSPDGQLLATWAPRMVHYGIQIWDIITGFPVQKIELEFQLGVLDLGICANGKILVLADTNNKIRSFETATGFPLYVFDPRCNVEVIAVSPKDRLMILGSYNTIQVRNIDTGILMDTFDYGATDLRFSPDGSLLAVSKHKAGERSIIRVIDTATWGMLPNSRRSRAMYDAHLAFSPNNKYLAISAECCPVHIWNLEANDTVQTAEANYWSSSSLAFCPDGTWLTTFQSTNINFWDCTTGTLLRTLETGHSGDVQAIASVPNSSVLVSTSANDSIRFWDTHECAKGFGFLKQPLIYYSRVCVVRLSPNYRHVATMSIDYMLTLWDITTEGLVYMWTVNSERLDRIVASSPDAESASALAFEFSPDSSLLGTVLQVTGAILLYSVFTGELLMKLEGPWSGFSKFAFSPNGKILVATRWNRETWVWDVGTGALPQTLTQLGARIFRGPRDRKARRPGRISALAISYDSRILAIASTRTIIRISIWELGTGKLLRTLYHDRDYRFGVRMVFSPDSLFLAVGTKEIKIWDVFSGECLKTFYPDGMPRRITFSTDGLHILTDTQSFNCVPATKSLGSADLEQIDVKTLHVRDDWLCRGKEKLIWLPLDWRVEYNGWDSHENMIVLGHISGRVSLLEIGDIPRAGF